MDEVQAAVPWSFNENGDIFTLNTPEPPRDWLNVHYAENHDRAYYSLVNHLGAGPVFVRDEEGNKAFLTNERGERTIYFRREDTGQVWTIGGYPVFRQIDQYRCDYTPASTTLQSHFENIGCSQRIFVPRDAMFEIWTVEVTNYTDEVREVSVFPYSSIDLSGFPVLFRYGKTRMRSTKYFEEIQGLYTKNASPFAPSDLYSAFLIASEPPVAATGKPRDLFIPPRSFANPNLEGAWTTKSVTGYDENCMCLKVTLSINPGESRIVNFAFGTARTVEDAAAVRELIQDPARVERELQEVADHYASMNDRIQVRTGVDRIDHYINNWAPKQIESYLAFKKAYRDNLQIDMIFGALDYEAAKANLLDALSHQYEDGHAPHSFRPVVPLHYSDKPAWILMAVSELIRDSGEFSLLGIELPYIDSDGKKTAQTESVLGHVRRAMNFMFNDIGRHQMSRMHYADWLDGLDGLSRVGEGESVLTTLMFAAGLKSVIEMARAIPDKNLLREATEMYEEVRRRLNGVAWDGRWYMRGFSGNGEKVGSRENKYGQIYLNSQSWAIIAGVPDDEKQRKMLNSIDEILDTEIGRRLYHPSYTEYFHHIGCVSAQPPDYAMNAIYNHACAFSLVADCIAGRGEKAWEVLEKVMPDQPNNPVTQSLNEPYSLTNRFDLEPNYYGECGEPWRTNTAAWIYRGVVEFILGVRKDFDGLRIDPCLPPHLKRAHVKRVFRGCTYNIDIVNASGTGRGVKSVTIEGAAHDGIHLPLMHGSCNVEVQV